MYRFIHFLAVIISLTFAGRAFALNATFDAQNNLLTLPTVNISNNTSYTNVVLRVTSFGTVVTNDKTVGKNIEFNLSRNALLLPKVTVGSTTYSKVSLTGLTFAVVSINGVSIDTGSNGSYNLSLVITASGFTGPAVEIKNVPKPNTQGEFCSADIYTQFQQSVQGITGSWSVTSCSFDGTTGFINALLTVTSPFTMSMPYSVRYTYVAN